MLIDPRQLDAQIEQQRALTASAGSIPVLERQRMQQELEAKLQMSYVYGLSRTDPAAAQAALGVKPRPGQPGGIGGSPVEVVDISARATYKNGPIGPVKGFIFHHTGGDGDP